MTALTTLAERCDDRGMITNRHFIDPEMNEGLQRSDLDTILAVIIHTSRPDIQALQETMVRLLQMHAVLDMTGQQRSPQHVTILELIERLEMGIDATLVGVFN